MLSKSKDHNINYLAKVVRIEDKDFYKIPNSDFLKGVKIDGQQVLTSNKAESGMYIYFPVESAINRKLISFINGFRDTSFNINKDADPGFFGDKCRVKAIKLRGSYSLGFILPLQEVEKCFNVSTAAREGIRFDTINGEILLKKYQTEFVNSILMSGTERLIDYELHCNTPNILHRLESIEMDDEISITYKLHGTSMWLSHTPVKVNIGFFDKIKKLLGFKVQDTKYDYVYGSRRVVKNGSFKRTEIDDRDVWGRVCKNITIPKDYSIYGEICGYSQPGKYIQKGYDYGCLDGEYKLYIYKVLYKGRSLGLQERLDFCKENKLTHVPFWYHGKFSDIGGDDIVKDKETILDYVMNKLVLGNCPICNNKVPREGVVIVKEDLDVYTPFKLKSPEFLLYETKQLDGV